MREHIMKRCRFPEPLLVLILAIAFPSVPIADVSIAPTYGWKGQRLNGNYSWGWPKADSQLFKTYGEAVTWTINEAKKSGWVKYDLTRIVSNNLKLFLRKNIDSKLHNYFSHNHPNFQSPTEFTGRELRYCEDWQTNVPESRISSIGQVMYGSDVQLIHTSAI